MRTKPETHLLMFDEAHVERFINCLKNDLSPIKQFPLAYKSLNKNSIDTSNPPDEVMWSWFMRNAEPRVDSQSREVIKRRRLEEDNVTAMMLETETEGRMRERHGHCDYNYQLDSMLDTVPPSE